MKKRSLAEFVKTNRVMIDEVIASRLGHWDDKRSDAERRMWILNDESLYHWAKVEGVKL